MGSGLWGPGLGVYGFETSGCSVRGLSLIPGFGFGV